MDIRAVQLLGIAAIYGFKVCKKKTESEAKLGHAKVCLVYRVPCGTGTGLGAPLNAGECRHFLCTAARAGGCFARFGTFVLQ